MYVRVRPAKEMDPQIVINPDDSKIEFNLERERLEKDGQLILDQSRFRFNGILDTPTR